MAEKPINYERSADCRRLSISPQVGSLAPVRRFLEEAAKETGLDEARLFDLQVAASEACANAVEQCGPGDQVAVEIEGHFDRVVVRVVRPGPFRLPSVLSSGWEYRGLGLPLMIALSDELLVQRTLKGTQVVLTFLLGSPGPSERPLSLRPAFSTSDSGWGMGLAAASTAPSQDEVVQAVASRVPVGLCVFAPDLHIKWANATFCRLFAREEWRNDPAGLHVDEVLAEAVEAGTQDLIRHSLASSESFTVRDVQITGTDGQRRYWNLSVLPLSPAQQQQEIELMLVAREVTEEVLAQEQLKQLARQVSGYALELDATLEALPDAIVIYDTQGEPRRANATAAQQFGFKILAGERAERVQETMIRREDGSRVDLQELPSRRALRGETVHGENLIVRVPDGRDVRIRASAAPLILDREIRGAVAVWRPIAEREELHEKARESEALSQALARINLNIGSTLDPDEIMQRVVEEVPGPLDADTVSVSLLEGDRWVLRKAGKDLAHAIGTSVTDDQVPFFRTVQVTRRPLQLESMVRFGFPLSYPDEPVVPAMLLVVPLVLKEEVTGVITFARSEHPRTFSDLQVDFAEKLGAFVSVALENAGLYGAERSLARTLQRALLTVPPRLRGVEFGHLHRAPTTKSEVGGDFYDLFPIEGRHVGMLIGDVAGKGVEASALAALAKNTMKAYAYEGMGPKAVLEKTNRVLIQNSAARRFVTAFLGILDPSSGRLMYSFAGHLPPILLRHRGADAVRPTPLDLAGAPVLGIIDDIRLAQGEQYLESGDLLLLYTDGVTEARRGRDFFGEDRLVESLMRLQQTPVRQLPGRLLDEVLAFTCGRLVDDVALVAIGLKQGKRRALEAEGTRSSRPSF